jgi:glycerol-3-phosphate O-acyltransferase
MSKHAYIASSSHLQVDKAIGERRITNFTPVGISLCEELDVAAVLADVAADDKEAQQKVTCYTLDGSAVGSFSLRLIL